MRPGALVAFVLLAGCLSAPSMLPPAPDLSTETLQETAQLAASPADAVLRPGMVVRSYTAGLPGTKPGGSCSANFLFQSPANGTYYFGTAAHCLDDAQTGTAVALGFDGKDFLGAGTVAYVSFLADNVDHAAFESECNNNPAMSLDDAKRLCWNDFALISLNATMAAKAHPSMIGFGGPIAGHAASVVGSKVYTDGSSYYRAGNNLPNDRTGIVAQDGEWRILAYFEVPGTPGDSGSGVLDEQGHALGVLNTLHQVPPGANGVARLDRLLGAAAEHGWNVALVPSDDFQSLL